MGKHNLLILGASGGVATTLLLHLNRYRDLLNSIVLLDQSDRVVHNPYVDHETLRYTFVKRKLRLPKDTAFYKKLLQLHQISIVLDLTDIESIPLLILTNDYGASYINTCVTDDTRSLSVLFSELESLKKSLTKAAHILSSGMNPGVVNLWAEHGIRRHGVPKEIVHFEYDTSVFQNGWRPMQTWSPFVFLLEAVNLPAGKTLGRNKIVEEVENGLMSPAPMKNILSPILHLPTYPLGMEVLHDENITIANKYDIPSKFIYAINQKTMKHLQNLYHAKKNVEVNDLAFGDNVINKLSGRDTIGIYLEYADKRVYILNSTRNEDIVGSNATYTQVVMGVLPAILTLCRNELSGGIYFVEDVYETSYTSELFSLLKTEEFIFEREKNEMRLSSYTPQIVMRKKQHAYQTVMAFQEHH